MKLKQLVKGFDIELRGNGEINGLTADSRMVAPGNLFIARKGEKYDGSEFIEQAVRAGAAAVVTDIYDPFLQVAQIIAPDPGHWEAKLAARFYGYPSRDLFVVGITGTKGKTTTSYLVKHLLDGLGMECGLVGTVETIVGEHRFSSPLTTKDAITNQKLLAEMKKKGCKAAVLEASSIGLPTGRVDEIEFDAAIFTNLYPDHLDFHKTMEEYAEAKKILFDRVLEKAIVNGDSPWTEKILRDCKTPIWKFQADQVSFSEKGTEFMFQGQKFETRLMGRFNVYNLLGAIGVGLHIGAKLDEIAAILSRFESVPGRLEQAGERPKVFVDFAHTGEALENVLATLREIGKGKLIVVFGCGGERDKGRRKGMAQAAERFSDQVVITSDNPRGEDPAAIAKEILEGFLAPEKTVVELDRKLAIEKAIGMAKMEDIVLIAGKGHEKVQIFAHQTVPFDDVSVAKEVLKKVNFSVS